MIVEAAGVHEYPCQTFFLLFACHG